MTEQTKRAIFAGGCFWCTEAQFAGLDGVVSVTSGYTGGHDPIPTYERVCSKKTGHAEAVEIIYDPAKASYESLLDIYWSNIDPTDPGGQFFDRGDTYRTVIFYTGEDQRRAAQASKETVQKKLNADIATQILPAVPFYPAEDYHQNFYRKNTGHYNAYKKGSGRESFLKAIWKK